MKCSEFFVVSMLFSSSSSSDFFFSERILQERDRNDVNRNVKCPKKVNISVAARWFYWE